MSAILSHKLLLAVALQVAILLGIVAMKYTVLAYGTQVLVRIAPIEPTDPLRGDYALFRLTDFEHLEVPAYTNLRAGNTVWVPIEKRGTYDAPAGIPSLHEPPGLSLRGTVTRVDAGANAALRNVHLRYGLEQYYIPERTAQRRPFPTGTEVYARIAIDSAGNAVVKEIQANGKPWP